MNDTATRQSPVGPQTWERMERGYLEYRKACSVLTLRNAEQAKLLDVISGSQTAEEVANAYGCAPSKVKTLSYILDVLAGLGALERAAGTPVRYTRVPGVTADTFEVDRALMASAVGEAHAATLVDESSFQAMVDDLLQNENTVGADFDAKHLTHWDDFLEMPFYKLHRDEAVRAISHTGARCLDIGSGLGYGLADLTRRVGADGIVVGVERSTDFMAQSLARLGGASPVRHVHADVEVGLQFLQTGFFDGAMIVGAFHFIRNREGLFSEVSRILRPGGRFCIGHGFVSRSSPDLEIMELRFATRAPIGHPVTDRELASLAREHGMRGPVRTHYTGCMGWFEFERPH